MKTVLISVVIIGISVALIAVKILFKKRGTFAGTCASNNPLFQGEGGSCPVCGANPDEKCNK